MLEEGWGCHSGRLTTQPPLLELACPPRLPILGMHSRLLPPARRGRHTGGWGLVHFLGSEKPIRRVALILREASGREVVAVLGISLQDLCWAWGAGSAFPPLCHAQSLSITHPGKRGKTGPCATLRRRHSSLWRTICYPFLENVPTNI